jgi:hypothetical protein
MSFDTKRYRFRYRENRPKDRKVRNLYRGGFDTGFDPCLGTLDWNGFRYQTIPVSNPRFGWLNQCDVLIKADLREPLIVLRMSLAAEIARRTV